MRSISFLNVPLLHNIHYTKFKTDKLFIDGFSKKISFRDCLEKIFDSLSVCFTIRIGRKIEQSSNKLEQFRHVYSFEYR